MPFRRALAIALISCFLLACNRQGPQLAKPVDDNRDAAAQRHGDGVESVTVDPNAAKAGSEVDAAGDVVEASNRFKVGQTVYVSVPTKYGRKQGEKLDAFWFTKGLSRKEDSKHIEGAFTVFEFSPSEAGAYNVEVDANGRPIALVQFDVD